MCTYILSVNVEVIERTERRKRRRGIRQLPRSRADKNNNMIYRSYSINAEDSVLTLELDGNTPILYVKTLSDPAFLSLEFKISIPLAFGLVSSSVLPSAAGFLVLNSDEIRRSFGSIVDANPLVLFIWL
jgi:hypothetical protein